MARVKAWKRGAPGEPSFPEDFEVVKKQVLQFTDLAKNNNKYYCLELHQAAGSFRVFTHYGRTGDLDNNPNAGVRESRYCPSLPEAEAQYEKIYKAKTKPSKGYQEINLASSKIGSQQSRGQSTGEMDDKTLEKIAANEKKSGEKKKKKKKIPKSKLSKPMQEFIKYIYEEATNALTTTANVKITANGIETPLGVLTIGQVEKGEEILEKAYKVFQGKGKTKQSKLEKLSGEFYTTIPHRLGRSRAAAQAAVLNTMEAFQTKQETLQLMKDMLQVNGDTNVLIDPQIDKKYKALNCAITLLDASDKAYEEIEGLVISSQIKHERIKVKSIFTLEREAEWKAYVGKANETGTIGNERLLYHGSRIKNWVGILSRGVLMPKIVVSMGVNRTDAGWLGSGIYFGDAACTSGFYTTPGRKRRTRLMAVHRVALGKMKPYKKITYGISEPPSGFDSCHGVRDTQFADDEFVIYSGNQQRQEFLVEFTM